MIYDNLRGELGGIPGEVLEGCEGDRVFYFIRKEAALRIQRNYRIYLHDTAPRKKCGVCSNNLIFSTTNYYCTHILCSECFHRWSKEKTGNRCPECRSAVFRNPLGRK